MKTWIAATSLHYHTPSETKCNWYDHHPLNILRKVKKLSASTGLVNMSAICFLVDMYLILISPDLLKDALTRLQKWLYLMAICFVHGVTFNDSAIAIANKLFSWSLIQKPVIWFGKSKMQLISLMRFWIGIVSHKAWDMAIYLASAIESAISVWSLLHHIGGQFAWQITKPVLDRRQSAFSESATFQPKEVWYQELWARCCSTTVDCVKYIVNMKYAICNM